MAEEKPKEAKRWIVYTIDDVPPWRESIFLGFQHYLTMFGATVLIPILLAGAMGMPPEDTSILIATIFFASGVTTWLQSTIGNKLPVIQGGSFSFLPPTFVIIGATVGKGMGFEVAVQDITGAIIAASFFEIILGWSGAMGYFKKFIGPVTIGPTIALIGLALYGVGAPVAGGHWLTAGVALLALIIYSQILSRKYRLFLLFPVLLAIITGWGFAAIMTAIGVFGPEHPAYISVEPIRTAPWFVIPFSNLTRWGMPNFKLDFALAMVAAYLASMIEFIGDYYAVARMSEAPVPTSKMISRGLGTEGIGCFIAGWLQSCNGSTTYSENIGAIGLTRVASRHVVRVGATIMLILGVVGKFGGIFATIPSPIVGAMYCGLFGMIASVGLSNLMLCDMQSPRNLFIIGFIFFMGLSLPVYFQQTPWETPWMPVVGNIVTTIGSTGMAVAGIFGIIMDNIIPGTEEERGLKTWMEAE
ncbi:MAG: uracil-xanthine permease family protein [Candidatus Methanofastidiosia archaeon]